jgi:hypothetical protein
MDGQDGQDGQDEDGKKDGRRRRHVGRLFIAKRWRFIAAGRRVAARGSRAHFATCHINYRRRRLMTSAPTASTAALPGVGMDAAMRKPLM